MGALELLATICIVLGAVKFLFIIFSPKSWLGFATNLYADPKKTSWIALILAAVVLYFLLGAGVTIVEIFAVMLFVSLLMLMSLAPFGKDLVKLAQKDMKNMWQKNALSFMVWIILLLWGIKVLI